MRLPIVIYAVGILSVIGGIASVQAATGLKLDGQVRLRTELDDRLVSPSERMREYSNLRTRLALEATLLTNTIVYLQLQDSRVLGGRNAAGKSLSGTQNDGKNVDMHQAYFLLKHLWLNGPGLKAGRFELNKGNQRVFGAGDWSNIGRAWEGMILWYALRGWQVELMWLKRLELDHTVISGSRDFDLILTYVTLSKIQLDLFFLYEHNHDRVFGESSSRPENALDRCNFGLYFLRNFARMTLEANSVYQTGEADSRDINAWMFALELAYKSSAGTKPRIAVGADVTSHEKGDDDQIQAYDNLYYTGHKFRGYMDYFVATMPYGLVDMYLRFGLEPSAAWKLALDIHRFNALSEIGYSGQKRFGYEVDATVSAASANGVTVTGGASLFFPKEDIPQEDPSAEIDFFGSSNPRVWLYFMIAASFSVTGEI